MQKNFTYISDFDICAGREFCEKTIVEFLNGHDGYVVDLLCSLTPETCAHLNNALTVFLGFKSVAPALLQKQMSKHGENITLIKQKSEALATLCKELNLPFYDINRDRSIILDEIFSYIKTEIE